jgi:hypothetical protein
MRTRADPISTEIPFGKCHPFAEEIYRNRSLIIATTAASRERKPGRERERERESEREDHVSAAARFRERQHSRFLARHYGCNRLRLHSGLQRDTARAVYWPPLRFTSDTGSRDIAGMIAAIKVIDAARRRWIRFLLTGAPADDTPASGPNERPVPTSAVARTFVRWIDRSIKHRPPPPPLRAVLQS